MEKEQKTGLAMKKNEKDFEHFYEICITDESNIKKDSK